MRKFRNYLVSISYEGKCDLIHHVPAKTKLEAEMYVINLFLLNDPKYKNRPLTSYRLKSCLENYKKRK